MKICLACGKEFKALAQAAKRGQERFCSKECCWKVFGNRTKDNVSGKRGSKGGKRVDLENRYFRSRWEANWARYLNWMKQRKEILYWEYEPETFEFSGIKRGSRFYTPDFKVVNPDASIEYHEVKGWMDSQSITKLKRMAKYHPEIPIIIVDKIRYKQVRNSIGPMIENWEQEDTHFAKLNQ